MIGRRSKQRPSTSLGCLATLRTNGDEMSYPFVLSVARQPSEVEGLRTNGWENPYPRSS